jgi:8-oxo-dGTP pyrophosphatase MutT (NUDIX family)
MNGDLATCVRAAVLARQPVDDRERSSIERFVIELDQLERPFDQEAGPVHITGSAIVIGLRGVVLLRHKRLGIWLQPGGHIDPGETPWAAARREATEETGLAVRFMADDQRLDQPALVHVDVHAGGRGHTHLDLRYVVVVDDDEDPAPPPGESQEIGWFDWDDAIALADDGLRGALTALRP